MINKSKKSKKSTSKKRTYSVSPLIPVIALVEVLVLIAVSTYAWFYIRASKIIGSGTISVAADSGLDIDFQYSNIDDYINIWNYVGSDFAFEPATSLDGRTIYFPTTGTFDNDTTDTTVFRDGTVNDINSKYLSIDFELTNTSEYDQYVYLNNNSYFRVQEVNSDAYEESRALRLAFYQNDGNSGNVGSSLLSSDNGSSDGSDDTSLSDDDYYTFYFDTAGNSDWKQVYAYFYNSSGSGNNYYSAWPGVPMSNKNGLIYALSMKQSDLSGYDKVIFNNGSGGTHNQTSARNITSCNGKAAKMYTESFETLYWQTVYFVKPYSWGTPKCKTYKSDSGTGDAYSDENMTYVGSGIYSYTYYYQYSENGGSRQNNIKRLQFHNGDNWSGDQQTAIITVSGTDKRLYYTNGQNSDNTYKLKYYCRTGNTATLFDALSYKTIYFFNTYGWEKPYATVSIGSGSTPNCFDLALVTLSGNVYYCNVPECYTDVYFRAKEQSNDTYRTAQVSIVDQQVYRPKEVGDENYQVNDNGHYYWGLNTFLYDKYIKSTGYPVISPGVSAGFQRPYSPVITIDAYSGSATEVVPAYSNSIDNYILHSEHEFLETEHELFVLKSGHMVSLSMIMWLEGTDEACTGNAYPGKQIDMRLEFSTKYVDSNSDVQVVNPGDSNSYIYNFYDKTRELWTSDRQGTESGVTVAPVMQLYDNTIKRGYLMSPSDYRTYDGKQKVSRWTVSAPRSIALNGHDIIFRRVNPYNEDEVWNYWHAGPVAGDGTTVVTDKSLSVYSVAQSTTNDTNDTINFTAFADGSPLSTMSGLSSDTDEDYCVPEVSCGGLWGNHTVRTVTVYDGLPGQPLKDNKGILTIRYNYQYKVGITNARLAKIEYKASGPEYNSFYYFVMPNVAYATNAPCAVKRYTGFESGFAINSAENNPNITFVDYYGEGQRISGDYFELNQKTNGDDYSYWGSDMLYVQTNADTKNYVYTSGSSSDSNAKLLQAYFTSNDNFSNRSSANNRFAYMYYNGNFSPDDGSGGSGFACVVPNDKAYTRFRLENCSYNGTTQYNVTDSISIQSASDITFSDTYTNSTNTMKVRYLNHNGIRTTYIGVTLYLQTTHCSSGNDPGCHIFDNDGNSPDKWPGYKMTWESDDAYDSNKKKFFVSDASGNKIDINVSKYYKVIFSYYGGSQQAAAISFDMNTVHNDMVYESYYGNGNAGLVTSRNDTNNNTLKYENWDAESWPHLTFSE